jgi:hypothetical protein
MGKESLQGTADGSNFLAGSDCHEVAKYVTGLAHWLKLPRLARRVVCACRFYAQNPLSLMVKRSHSIRFDDRPWLQN